MAHIFRRNIFTGEFEEADIEFPRAELAKRKCDVPRTYQDHNPLTSISLGCHPSQAAEFNAQARREGRTDVHYRPDGTVEFYSRGTRGRAGECKARNSADGDAGYGDFAGS